MKNRFVSPPTREDLDPAGFPGGSGRGTASSSDVAPSAVEAAATRTPPSARQQDGQAGRLPETDFHDHRPAYQKKKGFLREQNFKTEQHAAYLPWRLDAPLAP